MTNGEAIRAGIIPCETNPKTAGLSRTTHEYHGDAEVTVGQQKGNFRHVCYDCAAEHHRAQKQRPGIKWE